MFRIRNSLNGQIKHVRVPYTIISKQRVCSVVVIHSQKLRGWIILVEKCLLQQMFWQRHHCQQKSINCWSNQLNQWCQPNCNRCGIIQQVSVSTWMGVWHLFDGHDETLVCVWVCLCGTFACLLRVTVYITLHSNKNWPIFGNNFFRFNVFQVQKPYFSGRQHSNGLVECDDKWLLSNQQ